MKHLALTAILASSCVPAASSPPAQAPWGSQPTAATGPLTTGAGGGPAGGGGGGGLTGAASCRDTLACYYQCQLTEACIQSCDAQSAASAQSHAVIACMAQNSCTDNSCVSAKCSTEVAACGDLAPSSSTGLATATASSGAVSDVSYQAPAGWVQTANADTVMYDLNEDVQPGDKFYGTRFGRVAIFPPISVTGDLGDAFMAEWQQMIVAGGFKTQVVPIGMRRRLASGLGLIYDGGAMDLPQGGNDYVNLYLVVAGDRAVPVLGIFNDRFMTDSTKKEPIVLAFLASIGIKGEKSTSPALFAASELVGTWSTNSAAIGTWVTSSGSYAGDATTATWDTYQLASDGTYTEKFAAYSGGRAAGNDDKGKWSVDDGVLTLRGHDRTEVRPIFAIATTDKGTVLELASSYDGFQPINVLLPRQMGNGEWFGKE